MKSLCVISKGTYGKDKVHDIQTNSSWTECPYEDYVLVPNSLEESIKETRGFCDIVLNTEGTEVVSFTDRSNAVLENIGEDE